MAEKRRDIVNWNIKKELKKQGKTQSWLSTKTGIDRPILSNNLNRSAETINFGFLEKIAKALDVDVTYLLGYNDKNETGHKTYKDLVQIVSKDLSPYERMRDAMIVDAVQGLDAHLADISNALEKQNLLLDLLLKR